MLAALAALFYVMWLARRMAGLPAACVAGALFALNADMAVWETFVMTETLYIAAVCACACLMLLAHERKRPAVYAAVFAAVLLFAFIRPTGWILPPAALLFWLLNAPWKWRWRASASLAVVILFLAIAFGMPQARGGIEGQGPVAKLYAGEVVWQEALWRVNMPSPPQDTGTFAAACGYIARHPLACTRLALRRVAVLFLKVRPGYSRAHNALLLALYLPLALLGIAGFIICRRNIAAHAALTLVLAHALVVALTFNDNDGRFTLYITPMLTAAAAAALATAIIRSRTPVPRP